MWVKNVFPGALIEYAVILFKKQKEQKEPKKEAAIHRSSGNNPPDVKDENLLQKITFHPKTTTGGSQ